jgi:hypothetical protein
MTAMKTTLPLSGLTATLLLAASPAWTIDAKPKARPATAATAPAATTPAAPGSASSAGAQTPVAPAAGSAAVRELDWEDLIPAESKNRPPSGTPPPMHDYLGEGGLAAQQVMDFSVNKALDGNNVRLPGFIVPLEVSKEGKVTEFFLVPYVGACIHVPPPPPNQLIYVRAEKGLALESIWEAYWVTGKLSITNRSTRLGAAAYQLVADKVEIYKF